MNDLVYYFIFPTLLITATDDEMNIRLCWWRWNVGIGIRRVEE